MKRLNLPEFDGALYLLVDESPQRGRYGEFVGERSGVNPFPDATLHVMSVHSGGQVRGYFQFANNLHLSIPTYPRDWHELDRAVQRAVSAMKVFA